MARIIGRLSAVGIVKEAVRGTALAPLYWVGIQSLDFDDKVEYIDNDSSFGRIEELNDSAVSKRWAEGGYEGKVFATSIGVELVGLFGGSPTSVQRASTLVYDHTFALVNSNTHQSLCIAYKDANLGVRYALAMVDEFELTADLDKWLTRSIKFKSKASATASDTVAQTDEAEFMARHISFKTAAVGVDPVAAGVATPATNFTLSFSKNVEVQYVFGPDDVATNAAKVDNIINQQFGVEGSFEAYMDDLVQRGKVLGGTKQAIAFEAINTDVLIGTGNLHSPAIRFTLPKVAFTEFERGWDSNAATKQTINFKGLFDFTTSAEVTARLTNLVASY